MKKLILLTLCFCFLGQGLNPAFATKKENTEIEFSDGKYKLRTKKDKKVSDEPYVRIRKKDLDAIRRQAFISRGLLQRIRDLETLYKQVKSIIETINSTIKFVKSFLNIKDSDIENSSSSSSDDEYEHISGVIMSPGYVEFLIKTTDKNSSFDAEGIADLAMDIYYNKNLFTIDHLEGDGIEEDGYRTLSVSSKTSGAKDRLIVPLTDVLANETVFRLYLAPRNPDLIKVGDSTKLDIRYYKSVPKNDDGERIPPVQYSFTKDSARKIEVVVK